MKTESQVKAIKQYLLDGEQITGLEALNLFGSMRLPARIHDIKALGYNVLDRWVNTGINGKKRVKQYYMEASNGA